MLPHFLLKHWKRRYSPHFAVLITFWTVPESGRSMDMTNGPRNTPFLGDHVWLFDPTAHRGRANKLILPWVGPYIIKERFDVNGKTGVTYRISLENGRRQLVVYQNRLHQSRRIGYVSNSGFNK